MELVGILLLQIAALFAMFGLPAIRDRVHEHAQVRRRRRRFRFPISGFRFRKATTHISRRNARGARALGLKAERRSRSCLTAQSLL
jgi:hypothetical protein